MTIFHKASQNAISINLKHPKEQTEVSFFFRKNKELVNFKFGKDFSQKGIKDIEEALRQNNVEKSVEDVMWKEVNVPKLADLPSLYMRLSKIRLTGNNG